MHAYRVRATLTKDSTLTLDDLPFAAGETVQVVIASEQAASTGPDRYPLRGTPVHYVNPTKPVADSDWNSAR